MKKRILGVAALGFLAGTGFHVQAMAGIATVTNAEAVDSGQNVLVYKSDRAVTLGPGESLELDAGDLVMTLSGSTATVVYRDGCSLLLGGNHKLRLARSDEEVSCTQRVALGQKVELYAQQGLGGAAVVETGTVGAANWPAVVLGLLVAPAAGALKDNDNDNGDGGGDDSELSPFSF